MATPNQNDETSNTQSGLDGVADDIHYLIISELMKTSQSAVLALAQSSRALREAALPFIYRDLVLAKGASDSWTQRAYNALIEQFRDDKDGRIAKHVRTITVKAELPSEDLMLIFDKISESGTLRKLSWETSAHIPVSVLDKLHATWPDLELSVRVLDRQSVSDRAHRQMDTRLLSSPLLVSLIYTIYNQGYHAEQPSRSEWPKLTQALVAGGNVRVLRIQSQQDGTEYRGTKILDDNEPKKLTRLDITPESRLPPLEELSIDIQLYWGGSSYLWDAEHCLMLRDAMDWSHLRKLDFGGDNPYVFFSAFTGLLPNLRALRFGVTEGQVRPAKVFIKHLTAVESLDIARAQLGIDALWPAIMKHKNTLKEIILRPTTSGYYAPQYIDFSRLETIAEEFPALQRLGWDVPCKENIDDKYLAILSTINLKQLDLFLHLPFGASDFSAELTQNAMGSIPPPPLKKKGSKNAAIAIMEAISQAQERPLGWLTLHFSRTGLEDRGQPYLMQAKMQLRRSKGESTNGAKKYEFRGKQEWYGLLSLEEELALEEE